MMHGQTKIKYNTQFTISITSTCFGTGLPSSGNLRTQRITNPINTWSGVLYLWSFVFADSLKMALRCRNM